MKATLLEALSSLVSWNLEVVLLHMVVQSDDTDNSILSIKTPLTYKAMESNLLSKIYFHLLPDKLRDFAERQDNE